MGLRIGKSCSRSSDVICEPLEGFYCIEQNKGSCRFTEKHSECHPGQYIEQAGTALSDTVCADCRAGTYSNGSFTVCRPHSDCASEHREEIKPGTISSDVECGKSVPVPLVAEVVVGVIAGVSVGVVVALLTAVVIKIYHKLKQMRQVYDGSQVFLSINTTE
ncbi:hypothetical protein Q8A67_005435 [Cirrhinus molitorella]|uniref:TNFR-Cys domain-containing protein n=1 Tax=Cirrhinus molitorella TaxID=172907 RepID=A0AA88Q3P7_9TELE|nr:hypothetical protein Q8A67_005435 [Cirrhinus molitorella]